MFNGFEPVYNHDSKILILGSFPSVKSRQAGFYYGNKQNRFWKMLQSIFNEKIDDDIENKKEFLIKHKIALYDVVIQSDLSGSSDISLEKSKFKISDMKLLLPPNTNIEKILCNGKTAYNLFIDTYKPKIPVIYMPSTSSANPRFDLEMWKKEILNHK